MVARGVTFLRRYAVCAVATLAMTVSYVDRQTLAALAPTVRPALHLSQTQYGWITGAFSIAYLIFAPLSGALVDRLGGRRTIVFAVLAWSLVSAGHALIPGFTLLFFARILLGVAEAPSFPAAAQTVRRMLPPSDRGTGYGLVFTGSSIGGMIVAPVAIALATHFGWRWAFVLVAAIGLAWIPIWLGVTAHPDVKLSLDSHPVDAPKRPIERSDLGHMARAVILVMACAPAIMFVFNWYPQLLKDAFGIPQEKLGWYLWAPPLLFDLGSVGFGYLGGKRDDKRPVIAIGTVLAATIALVPRAQGPIAAVVIGGIAMIGGGCLYSVLTQEMFARVPADRISIAGGTTAAAQSLSHIIAAPLVGRAIDKSHGSYFPAMIALGIWIIPGALIWLLWPPRTERARAHTE
jgi:ACS family hexuronate transporter-like MFS transporter